MGPLRARMALRWIMSAVAALTLGCAPPAVEGIRHPRRDRSADQRPPASQVASDGEVTFLGTVTSVDTGNLHHPYLRWHVNLKVDEVIAGPSPGEGFWFAIHSPTEEGIKVGERYRIIATRRGDQYTVLSRDRFGDR